MNVYIDAKHLFMKILEQDVVDPQGIVGRYRASNGLTVVQSMCPDAQYNDDVLTHLFLRGRSSLHNFNPVFFKSSSDMHKAFNALKEYCEHFNWELITNEDFGRVVLT